MTDQEMMSALYSAMEVVCLGKTGPILERADCGERIGESYGTSTFYAGTDYREAA